MNMTNASPVDPRKRIVILDALRGFALLGIVCANFPEFSLWSFMSGETREAIPYSAFDKIVNWLLYIFIDGKFYTIFSILFGIGFSIIIERARSRGANGMAIFHRRMILLLLIGVSHMLFLWSGDILTLYAAMGLLLPLFSRCDDKTLLRWALFFLLLPVIVEVFRAICGDFLSSALYDAWWKRPQQMASMKRISPHGCEMPPTIHMFLPSFVREQLSACGSLSSAVVISRFLVFF